MAKMGPITTKQKYKKMQLELVIAEKRNYIKATSESLFFW